MHRFRSGSRLNLKFLKMMPSLTVSLLLCSYFFSGPPITPSMHGHYLPLSQNNISPGFVKTCTGSGAGADLILDATRQTTPKLTLPEGRKIDGPLISSNSWCLEPILCIFWNCIQRTVYKCVLVVLALWELKKLAPFVWWKNITCHIWVWQLPVKC